MKRLGLGVQVFAAILSVALGTALVVGVFARSALAAAFDAYLASLPQPTPGRPRMGRMMLGAAEQAFIAGVDRSVLGAAIVAVAAATVVAVLLAAYLARPLRRLEHAAETLADGDLSHRVEVDGPAEASAIADAFNRMADSLAHAEALRRRMVADVAHELRNPLAAARAQAEGMAEGVLAVDEARIASIAEDLRHLSALVIDLQELAVAEAGALHYEMAETDVAAIAANEAERARPLLAPGVEMRIETGEGPRLLRGDERRLAQVMRNLLTNAARYTERGTVSVEVTAEDDRVVVRVRDTGSGIPSDHIEQVFERFWRADAARADDTGGAGLGLAIARTIVRDHGGDMFATSEPGRETVVGFWLPMQEASTAQKES